MDLILRRVVRAIGYRRGMRAKQSRREAVKRPLAQVLSEVAGSWVAVDRRTNEPRAVAKTPYELAAILRAEQITGVAVVRAPDPSESELVGLG